MSVSGIHGQLLEVTVVACSKLKDTEWISRQDPYVVLEYGSTKFRTRTCTDGHKNPTFQEKFVFTLIEGLRELNVVVWNSNTMRYDDLIGSGKVQLHKVLSQGYDDSSSTLQTKTGRYAGEVRLILHYASANKPAMNHSYQSPYSAHSAPPPSYPSPYSGYPAPLQSYPQAYPPSAPAYPPAASAYPPQPTAYPPATSAYPPPLPTAYPPAPYPPQSMYPPPPQHGSNPFPGLYPPPHY